MTSSAAVAATGDPVANYEAHLRQQVAALLAEHGESHLQKLLQQDIATCKKKDSELNALKGKVKVASEEIARLQDAIRKVNFAKAESEAACRANEETIKRREQLTKEMSTEMEAHREAFKVRMEAHFNDVAKGIAEREEKIAAVEAENETLEKQLEEHKAGFEAFYNRFQDSLKDRTSSFEELLTSCQTTTLQLEKVQSQLMLVRRERSTLDATTATLKEQLRVYEAQFETFAKSTVRPEDVSALAAKQQEQAQMQLKQLEEEKSEANRLRLQADKETSELRARLAALKKEVQQAEKAKMAAEKRCRQAQEKARQQPK